MGLSVCVFVCVCVCVCVCVAFQNRIIATADGREQRGLWQSWALAVFFEFLKNRKYLFFKTMTFRLTYVCPIPI